MGHHGVECFASPSPNGPEVKEGNINGIHASGIPYTTTTDGEVLGDAQPHLGKSKWIDEPVAIIGMAMRLPGEIHDATKYWEFLTSKGNARSRIPTSRYNTDAFYRPGKRGYTNSQHGYFLENVDLTTADTSFWSMSRKELEVMDPQQRLMLEIAYECLENSGAVNYKGKNIGCFVGVYGEDWSELQIRETLDSAFYRIPGTGDFTISNRISYELGLVGPSMTVRTACSSALYALYNACSALHAGECSSAIVGGSNLILTPQNTMRMTNAGSMSPLGISRSFDAAADGYARAEAVNAIHVKKLSDAIRDRDPIRAVIRSVCINSDGKSAGLTVPSVESHAALMRRSHEVAGITDLSKTAMIECHATGTPIGDPLEATAVAEVFGGYNILIGSVKPNLGHSEGASGISSLIKMVLALENQIIPPNIHFAVPNPKIPFERSGMRVPVECEKWPAEKAERVGVNSFGIGGANAHVLLESAKSMGVHTTANDEPEINASPRLLVFSAAHPDSTRQGMENIKGYLEKNLELNLDISYTLNCRRERFPFRAFAISHDDGRLEFSNVSKANSECSVIWIFTGQGAQYAEMGRSLMTRSDVFRDAIRRLDASIADIDPSRSWLLEDELVNQEETSRLSEAEFSQPCCTAIQIGLVDVLIALGIQPAAVVGHSSGEIAAAYAAGILSAHDAIAVAYHRGKISSVAEKDSRGGMLAVVGLEHEIIQNFLTKGIIIGCENSPKSVTLSGDTQNLEGVARQIHETYESVTVTRLKVKCAYHSAQMMAVDQEYLARLQKCKIHPKKPAIRFFSSVTGQHLGAEEDLDATYWCRNLTSPVLFHGAVSQLLITDEVKNPIFVEIGPHSALSGPLRQIGESLGRSIPYVPAMVRKTDAYETLLRGAGSLFQLGVSVQLQKLSGGIFLPDLPGYSWHYQGNYWSESRLSRDWRLKSHLHHDLLGSRITDGNDLEPTWRNLIGLEDIPWISEHVVMNEVIFPGAGYVAMAGEAARQLNNTVDFTIRDMHILSAMAIPSDKPIEVITQVRPVRITASMNSASWYEFNITSLLDGRWTRHCHGKVRSGKEFVLPKILPEPGPRHVKSDLWYRTMKRSGAAYGTRFQGLRDITASVSTTRATAKIKDQTEPYESHYTMHPATIDSVFQLFSVAVAQGIPRLLSNLSVPTAIEEIYIQVPRAELSVETTAQNLPKGSITGNAIGVCGIEPVFYLKGLKMSRMSDESHIEGPDPHAAAQLVWKPDVKFVNIPSMFPLYVEFQDPNDCKNMASLIEELTLTAIIETDSQVCDIAPALPHYEKFRSWLRRQCDQAQKGEYRRVPRCCELVSMTSMNRIHHVQDLMMKLLNTPLRDIAQLVDRVFKSSVALFQGSIEPVNLLMGDDGLANVYNIFVTDPTPIFPLLSHAQPIMRILEIGAGTGSFTAKILPNLHGPNGERMYSSYTYTEISAAFFQAAQERFQQYEAIEYRVLDITANPKEQGFQLESYDLVIAANVLHATPNLQGSLKNVKSLLCPAGNLFIVELSPTIKCLNYIMGILPGWWLGENDNRIWEPYTDTSRWEKELSNVGLSAADNIHFDGYINMYILAQPQNPLQTQTERITVLCAQDTNRVSGHGCDGTTANNTAQSFIQFLDSQELPHDVCFLGDDLPPGQMIVSLIDCQRPLVHELTPKEFHQLQSLWNSGKEHPILWITKSSQVFCKDPRYSMILGIARTVRRELGIDLNTLELDIFDESAWAASIKVIKVLMNRLHPDTSYDPCEEWAYSSGRLLVGRLYPMILSESLQDKNESQSIGLQIKKPGLLQSLSWTSRDIIPVGNNWVEVDVHSVGLNFKDVLIAMGFLEDVNLGLECAGVVRRVGTEVTSLCPGDKVMAFPAKAALSTTVITTEARCFKMARDMSFADAASMGVVYSTVIYSLFDIARVQEGDTVLIHAACSGIGLAAIQICRMLKAQIYCTVGTPEKVGYLRNVIGIPEERIFNSRNTSFRDEILAATNGRGVDVVLNSLAGELLHASWQCVAEFGTMVEIGKQDFMGKGSLAMDMFERNRTFAGFDLTLIRDRRQKIMHRVMTDLMTFYALGHISPPPIHVFTAAAVENAFRYMQKGTHIGKVVIDMKDSKETIPFTVNKTKPAFRSDGCYLLVGGLGGIGRAISSWMVANGARRLVYLSRSSHQTQERDSFVQELRAQDCRIDVIAGDISNFDDVDSAFSNLDQPVVGVIHSTMALADAFVTDMTFEEWQNGILAKVQGTWNLHNSLEKNKQHSLDFFVLLSSLAGLAGNSGQANYAAASTFLDSFVQFRHSLNLACSVVDIGVMEDVGYVSNDPRLYEHFRSAGNFMLKEQEMLDALHLAIRRSKPSTTDVIATYVNPSQVIVGLRSTTEIMSPQNRYMFKRDSRATIYRNLGTKERNGQTGEDVDELKRFLTEAALNPTVLETQHTAEFLAREAGKALFSFVLRDPSTMDLELPLDSFGIDSLLGMELRNWFRHKIGVDITVRQIMSGASLMQLGKDTAKYLASTEKDPAAASGSHKRDFKSAQERYLNFKAP